MTHWEARGQMELLGVEHDYRCRVFSTTLSDSAQEWYWKLKPGSITSWEQFRKEFCNSNNARERYARTLR